MQYKLTSIPSSMLLFNAKSRYLLGAGQASGYEELPFPSSAGSVCPPLCTLFANLQEDQTSLVQPVSCTSLLRKIIRSTNMRSMLSNKGRMKYLSQQALHKIFIQ